MPRLHTTPAAAPEKAPPTPPPHEPRRGPTPARGGRRKPRTAAGPGHAPPASAEPQAAAAFAEPICLLDAEDQRPEEGATGVPPAQPAVADRPAPGKQSQLPRRPPPLAGASAQEEGASSASSGRRTQAAPAARTPVGEAGRTNTAPSPAPKLAPNSQRPPRPGPCGPPAQPAGPAPVRAEADPQAQPGPARAASPGPPERQAFLVGKALVPSCMAAAFGLDTQVGAAGYRGYLDGVLKDAGEPTDPIEVMMLEQLAFAHLGAAYLLGQAGRAEGLEAVALYNAAAARLLSEFRKSALVLRASRDPAPPRRRRQAKPAGESPPPAEGPGA
jgi:hypothetical protein